MKQFYIQSKNKTAYQLNRIKSYLQRYTMFEIVATTLILLFGIWFTFSIIDIILNNLTTYSYAKWNLIDILSNKFWGGLIMSTAARTRKYNDIFTTKEHKDYITLYLMGKFIGNFDNWNEIEEAKHEILGY